MNKRPLFAAAIGFVLGEVCAWRAESGKNVFFVLGIFAVCYWITRKKELRKSRSMHKRWWILLLLCVFFAGYCRMAGELRRLDQREKRIWEDGEAVSFWGNVEKIREKEKNTVLTVKTGEMGSVLVYWEQPEEQAGELRIGERLFIKGECSRFQQATNPGQFDFRKYYRSQGILTSVFAWEVERENEGEGAYSPYLDALYRFRRFSSRIFAEICGEEEEGIFCAAILGEKEKMDQEVRDLYQSQGIAHLLAISGLHLSLIGTGFYRLLRKCGLGYGASGAIAALGIFSYGLLTGASGSAMRAVIMLSVSFLAAHLGRTYDGLSALSLAALLLAGTHPLSITQSSFQLSFGAVLGIGLAGKALEGGLRLEKPWTKGIMISLSVQLATAPVVLWHYFQIPVYGVLLNLIVVPLMSYVVISGLLGLAFGAFSLEAGMMAVGTGHYLLRFYRWLCEIVSRLPGGLLIWGRPKAAQVVLYYLFLGAMLWGLSKEAEGQKKEGQKKEGQKKEGQRKEEQEKKKRNHVQSEGNEGGGDRKPMGKAARRKLRSWGIFAAGVWFCCLCMKPRPQAGLDITVLDVGQGDGIVLQGEGGTITVEGMTWLEIDEADKERIEKIKAGTGTKRNAVVVLMDGGSTSDKRLGENRLEPYLKAEGIAQIDFAIVSHGDEDHCSGLRYLLHECPEVKISCLVLPEAGRGDKGYDKLIAGARTRGIPVAYMDAGDKIQAGAYRLTCFYPGKEMDVDFSDRNQQSLVIQADYQDFHMLFTGDVDQEGELLALEYAAAHTGEEGSSSIQVLKAAHHGSRFSSGEQFLAAIHPRWTILSYQEGNSYGHPHQETLERLQEQGSILLETGKMGAILLHVEDGRAQYCGWRMP